MLASPYLCAALMAAGAVMACGASEADPAKLGATVQRGQYLGMETNLLEGGLVSIAVNMRADTPQDLLLIYARCAAAEYTITSGFSFARHIRTNISRRGGNLHADGVYTISAELPLGLRNLDAQVVVADCAERGIFQL